MFGVYLIKWWYGRGWGWVIDSIGRELHGVGDMFAIKVLLKTWFSPWKQITTTYANETIIQRILDNTISRVIGGIIRTGALIGAGIWTLFIMLWGTLLLASWAFLPLAPVVLFILFVTGTSV